MKKEYDSPELDVKKMKFSSVLTITPSTYDPDPQDPGRSGVDDAGDSGDL